MQVGQGRVRSRLMSGVISPMISVGVWKAIIFQCYTWAMQAQKHEHGHGKSPSWEQVAIAAGLAGFAGSFWNSPFELIKIRSQMSRRTELSICRQIWQKSGILGIYRGLGAHLILSSSSMAVWFACNHMLLETAQSYLECDGRLPFIANFFCGGIAGALSWTMIYPADVLKTHMQASESRASYMDLLHQIRETNAGRSYRSLLFRGFAYTLFRSVFQCGITMSVYETLM